MGDEETLQSALRALAPSPVRTDEELVLVEGNVRITVSSRADAKSAWVRLRTPYDANARGGYAAAAGSSCSHRTLPTLRGIRPMNIVFRAETPGDREGKARGQNVEVETGDPAFDAAVYVDTPTTDGDLLRAVLNADVREAVLAIFALRADSVSVDDDCGSVEVQLTGRPRLVNDDSRAVKLVHAVALLARAVPHVTATGEKHASPPWFGRIVVATLLAAPGVLAMPISFLYVAKLFGGTTGVTLSQLALKEGYGPPRLVGFASALFFGLLAVSLVRTFGVPALSGRTDSRSRIQYLYLVSFALFAEVGFVVGSAVGYGTLYNP